MALNQAPDPSNISKITINASEIIRGGGLNFSFWDSLPPELMSKISGLITILKVAGVVVVIYFIILILRWFLNIKKYMTINKIYKKVEIIDKKLDLLIGKKRSEIKGQKTKKGKKDSAKKSQKKGFFSVFKRKK